ncbi:MAG: DegV family protein, partial [Oscillospiraceae bacterium]|nr:DegV family protein [Oscillospiraceae bacterium]
REKYPDRKLIVVDSLCSSSGYGLLVDAAADMRDAGCSMEETEQWLMANRNTVHHQFFSTDLRHYKRSGRVSGAAATVGTILNICPIMRLDAAGRIVAYDKVRGKQAAIKRTVDTMEKFAKDGAAYSGKCWICNSNCPEIAEKTREAVKERFPNITGEIKLCDIGTIIAAHCGPGTCAVFFFGQERVPLDSKTGK